MTTATTTKTTTTKGNRKLPFPIDIVPSESSDTGSDSNPIDELQERIALAQGYHLATKKSAMEAVAHACVYSRMITDDVDLQKWEKDEIDKKNAEIKRHNKRNDEDKKRSLDFVLERLDKEDWVHTADTEEDRKKASEEKVRLKTIATRKDVEWKALNKVEIKGREGAGYSATVKFVFGLDRATDAPTVSRYQHVMQWVYDAFGSEFPDTHEPIIQAINDAHGFDAVLEKQRAKKAGKPANDNADKKAEKTHAEAEAIRKSVQAEPAKASVPVDLAGADGLVIVLGRYTKGTLEVVRYFNVAPDELNKLLVRYATDAANDD